LGTDLTKVGRGPGLQGPCSNKHQVTDTKASLQYITDIIVCVIY